MASEETGDFRRAAPRSRIMTIPTEGDIDMMGDDPPPLPPPVLVWLARPLPAEGSGITSTPVLFCKLSKKRSRNFASQHDNQEVM